MSDARIWYALYHEPGPAVPAGTSVFDHPGIAEHYAFLQRRNDDGSLVAAGPLLDQDGVGLTVIEASSLDEARRLATTDDASVISGVLTVSVRPWRVVMAR